MKFAGKHLASILFYSNFIKNETPTKISNGLKSKRVSNFVINYCQNCLESEVGETKEHDFWGIFFIFKYWKILEI